MIVNGAITLSLGLMYVECNVGHSSTNQRSIIKQSFRNTPSTSWISRCSLSRCIVHFRFDVRCYFIQSDKLLLI